MSMNDPFADGKEAFSLSSLTAAIQKVPFTPTRLASLGLYEEDGVPTLTVNIDEKDGVLSLVPIKPRGASGSGLDEEPRVLRPFGIPHLPQSDAIMADEVQGVRMFGTQGNAELIQDRINSKLAIMRRNIDYTMEAHRVGNLKGLFYDTNGNAISLFTAFGVTQQTQSMELDVDATKVRSLAFDVLLKVKDALGGLPFTTPRVLCGDAFWKLLIVHPDVERSYLNTVQASELRGNPTKSFEFAGMVWEWYSGTTDVNVGADDAYVVPMGVPGLFITRFGPANYAETVNTKGIPYYAKSEPMKFGKGMELEAQSNPINLVTRPRAIIKLTKT